MKTDRLRSLFLDYFKALHHTIVPSDSLVPKGDPTLLFTGAGMNQFKGYFLGEKKGLKRAASCQKCIRTADLDRVGETATHHAFFEMLGNFSFGDYFKEEAIKYAWNFVTRELRIDKNHLWVSVFEKDPEAYTIWRKKIGVHEKRIRSFSAADNFWPANAPTEGPNGPCGPCSEIFYGRVPPNGIEIWNLVFTQYDRQEDGFLKPLPLKNIDTGMGLERLAAVVQGVPSNFEIDLFKTIQHRAVEVLGEKILKPEVQKIKNALLDHIRAIAFAIGDGVTPSNEGRGYVIRKIIRKCVLHLKDLGIRQPKLMDLIPGVGEAMQAAYPELVHQQAGIQALVQKEEEGFWHILENRIPQADIKLKRMALTLSPGKKAALEERVARLVFEFYDTYGVPKETLKELVLKNGLRFNEELFSNLIESQRTRSRGSSALADTIFLRGGGDLFKEALRPTHFLGYETLKARSHILGLLRKGKETERLEKGQEGILVLDRTPFYGEQGGQVGDMGQIRIGASLAEVRDTQWHDPLVLHSTCIKEGSFSKGQAVECEVHEENRNRIMKNHTATHLLHSALRRILGPHVKQNGSLVAPDRLRFDFTHFEPVKASDLKKIEELVNHQITLKKNLVTKIMPPREAMAQGALAFFGEKYGDQVRVVSIEDFSMELCGGTHVHNTGDIGIFRIIEESGVQAGVRRIEALTGDLALQKRDEERLEMLQLMSYFSSDERRLPDRLRSARKSLTGIQKKIRSSFQKAFKKEMLAQIAVSPHEKETKLLVQELPSMSLDQLREAADIFRTTVKSFAVVLSSIWENKPRVLVAFSKDLTARGLDASQLIKEITRRIGGSGGGRSDLAVGGGKDSQKLPQALKQARDQLARYLEAS